MAVKKRRKKQEGFFGEKEKFIWRWKLKEKTFKNVAVKKKEGRNYLEKYRWFEGRKKTDLKMRQWGEEGRKRKKLFSGNEEMKWMKNYLKLKIKR